MSKNTQFPEFNPKEFGTNVARVRALRGHSQELFAGMVDISPRTLGDIEAGRAKITMEKAFEIARKLEISIRQLLNLDENAVVNSFNNISQEANAQVVNQSRFDSDREHIQTLRERMAFLEGLVTTMQAEKAELREELKQLRRRD